MINLRSALTGLLASFAVGIAVTGCAEEEERKYIPPFAPLNRTVFDVYNQIQSNYLFRNQIPEDQLSLIGRGEPEEAGRDHADFASGRVNPRGANELTAPGAPRILQPPRQSPVSSMSSPPRAVPKWRASIADPTGRPSVEVQVRLSIFRIPQDGTGSPSPAGAP